MSKRDQLSEAEVKRRIRIQISDEERIKFANYIITNDGNNSIIQQTLKLYKTILSDLTND
ncbi:MAG: dephospho-CoA kinase [Saprospiraceae bacterium]|nr:dephospho-CoA kinase [Saprospiraceae bacterium]